MKVKIVKSSEVANHPTLRMDPEYWISHGHRFAKGEKVYFASTSPDFVSGEAIIERPLSPEEADLPMYQIRMLFNGEVIDAREDELEALRAKEDVL